METENLSVLLLHKNPEYLRPCCELINDEWPRSETARMMSLQASCDNLPTSLILINEKKHIIGHCKLTALPSIPEGCFIEAVVIAKVLRGKRLGSFLMKKAEEYCKNVLKLEKLYLSTKGQENFYAKLGYVICEPVSIYGSRLTNSLSSSQCHKTENSVPQTRIKQINGVPPPPPPPPIPVANINDTKKTIKSTKTYMLKSI